jgi:hypothetical protein
MPAVVLLVDGQEATTKPLCCSLDTMHRIKRAYSGKDSAATPAAPRRTPSNGREAAPGMHAGEAYEQSSWWSQAHCMPTSLAGFKIFRVYNDPASDVAAANGGSSYRTPQHHQQRPGPRPPEEGEFILTVKDVTSSSEGSFAGHIVHGEQPSCVVMCCSLDSASRVIRVQQSSPEDNITNVLCRRQVGDVPRISVTGVLEQDGQRCTFFEMSLPLESMLCISLALHSKFGRQRYF